jgi:hypothetical protein
MFHRSAIERGDAQSRLHHAEPRIDRYSRMPALRKTRAL